MSITDELRKFIEDPLLGYASQKVHAEVLTEIADHIDAEHQKAMRELNNLADASVLLPVDADGERIHVGDMMERWKTRGHVIALMLSKYPKKWGGELHWSVQLEGEQAPTALDAFFHHYREPTVEDVLREMLKEWGDAPWDSDEDDEEHIVAKFAPKLRLSDADA